MPLLNFHGATVERFARRLTFADSDSTLEQKVMTAVRICTDEWDTVEFEHNGTVHTISPRDVVDLAIYAFGCVVCGCGPSGVTFCEDGRHYCRNCKSEFKRT